MSGIFDNLFSVLPVVFAVIWVMRLVSRKKTSKEKASREKTVVQTAEPPEKKPTEKRISESLHRFEQKLRLSAKPVLPPPKNAGKETPRRVSMESQSVRLVENADRPEFDNWKPSTDRFKELSPLAQGMIWSVILDEPLSLKEPKL